MGILRKLFGSKYIPSSDEQNVQQGLAENSTSPKSGIYTGTATIVVYDLENLKHRLDDDVDWWADPEAEITELNRRNLLIIGLQFDDFYDVDLSDRQDLPQSFSLSFSSGKVFVGAGEMLTGGGHEPEPRQGGKFLDFPPGEYRVGIGWTDDRLQIGISSADAFENDAVEPIKI